jgi:hypothetical protein
MAQVAGVEGGDRVIRPLAGPTGRDLGELGDTVRPPVGATRIQAGTLASQFVVGEVVVSEYVN